MKTIIDYQRGCGWRKEGGLYMMGGAGEALPCKKLPIPLSICKTCFQGIKPTRGFTWINIKDVLDGEYPGTIHNKSCTTCADDFIEDCTDKFCNDGTLSDANRCGLQSCPVCPLSGHLVKKAGLIWIGESHYASPSDFLKEARFQGISRRIPALPNDLEFGFTPVFLAHRKTTIDGEKTSAIFNSFFPTEIQYICKGDEDPEKLENFIKRGITPVKVEKSYTSPAFQNASTKI